MFKSISYQCTVEDKDGFSYFVYELNDTEFNTEILSKKNLSYPLAYIGPLCIEYRRRRLPVPQNIALFLSKYYKYSTIKNSLLSSLFIVEEDYPKLNFSKTIYPCVMNELEKLKWIGKYK